MIRFSFANLAASASIAASTTFTEAETGVGLRHPERPHLRGYSPNLATHRITLDFGVATQLDVIALIHANFTAATIQGHASDAWGAPSYTQAITLTRSGGNRRYHHGHQVPIVGLFVYRFLSILVPTGTTTDASSQWALGGIWAGRVVSPPRDIRHEPSERTRHARKDIETADGRRLQRILLDHPAWEFQARRHARGDTALEEWREIDRQWAEADGGNALVLYQDGEPQNCYVMRRADEEEEWPNAHLWSESTIECFEVTSG